MVEVAEIPIKNLYIGECNVRRSIGDITELTRSIEEKGVLEPILVRPVGKKYEIVVGARRFEAAKAAGMKAVPSIVREMKNDEAIAASLIENIQRGDLEPEEEAEAINQLMKMNPQAYGSHKKVGKAIGLSEASIRMKLSVLELLPKVRKEVHVKYAPSLEERKEEVAIPFEHAAMIAEATRTEEVRKLPKKELEKKQIEIAKAITPLPQYEARKVVDYFKMYPKKPIEVIVEKALARETGIAIHVYFPPRIARILSKAAEERGISIEELVPIAVEEWLKRVGYKVED